MSVAERTPVAEILERAVSGERVTDEDAVELLRSRDLVAVGRAANEIRNLFPRLPNPDLVLYVYPHLSGTEQAPVPGYSTVFPFYQRVQYALPGERQEDL